MRACACKTCTPLTCCKSSIKHFVIAPGVSMPVGSLWWLLEGSSEQVSPAQGQGRPCRALNGAWEGMGSAALTHIVSNSPYLDLIHLHRSMCTCASYIGGTDLNWPTTPRQGDKCLAAKNPTWDAAWPTLAPLYCCPGIYIALGC